MRLRIVLGCALIVFASRTASAQFNGSLGFDLQSATNVERLDTTSPDLIAMPSVTLGYQFNPSPIWQVPIGIAWAPGFYSKNTSLSYTALSFTLTPAVYLSNNDDIQRQTRAIAIEALATDTVLDERSTASSKMTTSATSGGITNDQLIGIAVTDLYSVSVGLDSSEIVHKGLSAKQIEALESLRDSLSEALATVADLLDSVGYSEESVAVLVPELSGAAETLKRLSGKTSPAPGPLLADLQHAISELTATHAQAPSESSTAASEDIFSNEDLALLASESAAAPIITLISSSSRLRDFGASEIGIREDLLDSTARTLATVLTIPITYYTHTGRTDSAIDPRGNPNDSRLLAAGFGLDLYGSSAAAYRLSYDLAHSQYPFDSVYTNTENRFRLGARFGFGESAALFGNASFGLKNYTTPLTLVRQNGNKKVSQQVPSNFTQYSFGLGLSLFVSDRLTLGVLGALNSNPNLRAYVTDAGVTGAKKLRRAPQIAEDEYTYDLTRGAVFASLRMPLDIDAALDLSLEHRTYGDAAKRQALNQLVAGAGRTENGTYASLTLSKILPFTERAIGMFDGLGLEAEIDYSNVASSDAVFSYSDLEALAGFTLSF